MMTDAVTHFQVPLQTVTSPQMTLDTITPCQVTPNPVTRPIMSPNTVALPQELPDAITLPQVSEEITPSHVPPDRVTRPQVPPGYVLVNNKWNKSELLSALSRRVQTVIIDTMDYIDFYPATNFAVVYVTEADLVAENSYKRNLAKLKKASYEKNTVIVERTNISGQYFDSLQKFAVLELGLGVIPVSGFEECCQVLVAMVRMGSDDKIHPFLVKGRVPPLETYLLKTLSTIPSLGETKGQALLLKFKSLIGICNASEEELGKVIGASSAQQVYNFFHSC